jgi:serine/threonine-protein kinase
MTLLELLGSLISRGVGRSNPLGSNELGDQLRLEPGTVVDGRYRLTRLLGEGGMGSVWAAWHLRMRKEVAIKVIRPDKAHDEDLRRRFLREARAACRVRHPNIVDVHDVLELEGGAPAIVMDLLEGRSLRELLNLDGALDVVVAARILAPVTDALMTAHAAGVVHRDLKPDNIFLALSPDGETVPKVLDFGIAKLTPVHGEASTASARTETGTLLGTPFYMAPEQIFGERDVDARADVWSLGIILYECLAGARPTEAESLGQVFKKIVTDGIIPLREEVSDLPLDLALLVDRMLTRDRRLRLASLSEAFTVLSRYAGPFAAGGSTAGGEGPARPGEPTPAGPPDPAALPTEPAMYSTVDRKDLGSARRSRRSALVSAAAIPLLAALALGIWVRGWALAPMPSGSPRVAASPPLPPASLGETPAASPASSPAAPRTAPPVAISPTESQAADATPEVQEPGADAGHAPMQPASKAPPLRTTRSDGTRPVAPARAAIPVPAQSGVDAQSDAHPSPDRPPNTTNPGGVIEQPPF